jgi:nicotinamidase/pyrazinamidase
MNRRAHLKFIAAWGAASSLPSLPAFANKPSYKPGASDALIVVDVQNCFTKGGSLEVPKGDEVVPLINTISKKFTNVVITQDWHTPKHISFASSHAGKKPFDVIDLPYGKQVLWPDHCVQGTDGAALHKELNIAHAQLIVRKGYNDKVDSYSAFLEADRKTLTGLAGYLKAKGIKRVFVSGLATDFCVAWTAMDARRAGFEAVVLEDASRGIDNQGSMAKAWVAMSAAGVKRAQTSELA